MALHPIPSKHISNTLWDLWCLASVVGIWPRFIEPNLLSTTHIPVKIPGLASGLYNLKILHFSDLHLNTQTSDRFLSKLTARIASLEPDLILFSGDFLCRSHLHDSDRLLRFCSALSAPLGIFASLGNHDYNHYVGTNAEGDYDVLTNTYTKPSEGFLKLFNGRVASGKSTERIAGLVPHPELLTLLRQTPIQLLHNQTIQVNKNGAELNLCGLGDYMAGHFKPAEGFAAWRDDHPGVVMSHNPDSLSHLKDYPGNLVICGHTHGSQVYLPWLWRRFIVLENPNLRYGVVPRKGGMAFVTRGVGATFPFRFLSPPEVVLYTLHRG